MKVYILIDTYEYATKKEMNIRVTDSLESANRLKNLLLNHENNYYNRHIDIYERELETTADIRSMEHDPSWYGSLD